MKVLFLIDTLEGYGAESSLVEIARHISGVQPIFVHIYPGQKLKPQLTQANITVYSLNVERSYDFKKAMRLLKPIIDKEEPSIIHATLFRSEMVGRRLKKFYPNIILVGSFVSNSYSKRRYNQLSLLSRLKLFITQMRDRMTIHKVDFIISNSQTIKKTNMKALGVPEDKIRVIYRGRHFGKYERENERKYLLKENLGLKSEKILLIVGRLIKSKGHLDLLEAYKRLIESNKNVVLLIVGEGPLKHEICQNYRDLIQNQKVHLLGYRDDVPDLLALCDIFIFPSYFEGLSGALIEALIAKKPVIISNIPENLECTGYRAPLDFSPGHIEGLRSKIELAMEMPSLDNAMQASFQYARDSYNILNTALKYESFYKDVMKSKSNCRGKTLSSRAS